MSLLQNHLTPIQLFRMIFEIVWSCLPVERWMDDNIEENIKQLKNDLQSQDTLTAINLISYGSKSNVLQLMSLSIWIAKCIVQAMKMMI